MSSPTGLFYGFLPIGCTRFVSPLYQKRETVDNSRFRSRQTSISRVLKEHLLDCYQGGGLFISNNNKVKMSLEDVALISGLKVVSLGFNPNASDGKPTFQDRLFDGVK